MFTGLFEGLAWVLAFFFDLTHSYGLSIILLTITVMAVVTPLTLKGTKSMMAMQRLQPEMRRLQQEYRDDRQKLNEEMLKFYKENDINPMGSCLPLLIQMPIFLVLFRVVKGLTHLGPDGTFDPLYLSPSTALYQSLKGSTQMMFLGLDLEKTPLNVLKTEGFIRSLPYLVLIGLWVSTSYLQQRQVSGRNPEAMNPQQRMMMRVIPIFSLTAVMFPAALSIYWVTSNLCRVATQGYISQKYYQMGWLGFGGKKADGDTAVIDVKAKPAKPVGDGKKTTAPSKDSGPAKPVSGRVTPAKGKSTETKRPGTPPGRRKNSPSTNGDSKRRRTPNGPSSGTATPVDQSGTSRKKWRS
jgi:YidC/Oxa1 family membrane protein insertase